MNDLSAIHLEWIYTPEDYFQKSVTVTFEVALIEIAAGKIMAEIDPSTFQAYQTGAQRQNDQTEKLSEELDALIYTIAEQIEDKLETLFNEEQKKDPKPYQYSLLFKILIREDGGRLVLHA